MNHLTTKVFFSLALTLLILITSAQAQAQLSAGDRDAMTAALEKLNQGWDQPSVNTVNSIILKPQYTAAAWKVYFENYFASRKMTSNLLSYIGYPIFLWFDDATHFKLQSAMLPVARGRIEATFLNHPDDLGKFLSLSDLDRDELLSWLQFMISVGPQAASGISRRANFHWIRQLINAHPKWLSPSRVIDRTAQPHAMAIRMRVHIALRDTLVLNDSVKEEIVTTLGLTGIRLRLWRKHAVLVHDNNFFNARDLTFFEDLWDALPTGLDVPGNLAVDEPPGSPVAYATIVNGGGVDILINVYATHFGTGQVENGFPDDVSAYGCDQPALVAIHETNHIVDSSDVRTQAALSARYNALLNDAGNDRQNYLRSVVESGYFTQHPAEFFASISNMYVANTNLTFEVGRKRLQQMGRHQPIEQFLFFLDVYSRGSNFSRGYQVDTQARLKAYDIPLQRHSQNRIKSFTLPSGSYEIMYGSNGKVTAISQSGTQLATTTSAANYRVSHIARNAIVSAFGSGLATTTQAASALPLPTSIAGTMVRVKDSSGQERLAPLFYVSPLQVNYQIPLGMASGPVSVTITSGDGKMTVGAVQVAATAPSIFTVDQSGAGAAAALDAINFTAAPFAAKQGNGEPNIIALFATGLGADATDIDGNVKDAVQVTIDDQPVTEQYAGRAPGYVGLNQINFVLPVGIKSGTHTVVVWRGNVPSNVVTIAIK